MKRLLFMLGIAVTCGSLLFTSCGGGELGYSESPTSVVGGGEQDPAPADDDTSSTGESTKSQPDPSLICHLTFDESAEDGKYDDASEKDQRGTVHGDADISEDAVNGNSLVLDGDEDYVRISYHQSFFPVESMSVSLWIKPADLSRKMWVISNAEYYISGYDIMLHADIPWLSIHSGGTQWGNPSPDAVTVDEWHYITAVYSYDDMLHGGYGGYVSSLYVDGELRNAHSPSVLMHIAPAPRDMLIGCGVKPASWPDDNYCFDGLIDDLRIYGRVLSETEIESIYQEGLAALP